MGKFFSLIVKQKLLLAMLAAAVVGTAVYAFAATLNVSSGNLQAGNAAVTTCEASTDTINATYTTEYNSTVAATASNGSFGVKNVTLMGITAACQGSSLQINFTGTGGVNLGTGSGTATSPAIVAANTGASPATPLVVDVSSISVPAKLALNINLAVAG